MSKCAFAVVDTETTGFWAEGNDRIIEIAIVQASLNGEVLDEYATLVNPKRDLGATHVHGITARDVRDAPTFGQIAGDVVQRLADSVFVAHNASFDRRFVCAEMRRLDCPLPDFPVLCTMGLARRADRTVPSRKLESLCQFFGVPMARVHSSLHDARATACLLIECGRRCSGGLPMLLERLGVQGSASLFDAWPKLPVSGCALRREHAAHVAATAPSWIARLVARLPAGEFSRPEMDHYLSLLDRVLEDRRVTPEEGDMLFQLALQLDLRREEVIVAHRRYMDDLVNVARADGVISDMERRDLDEVRSLLQIAPAELEAMLAADTRHGGAAYRNARDPLVSKSPGSGPTLAGSSDSHTRGRTICFTGTLSGRLNGKLVDRAEAERFATQLGMKVVRNVTKTLDYLVTADPDSMSGKAERARRYGVRIISEPVFWRMVGISVE